MLTILQEFLTRSDDGMEMVLCECLVENDTTNHQNSNARSAHRDRYFRQRDGGMRAMRAKQLKPGVFELEDGTIVRRVVDD